MKRVLILAVDRDDDFGEKAGVHSPVVGAEACVEAAKALALADPEDSDLNALFKAVKYYNDRVHDNRDEDEPVEYQVALICGYSRVGMKSDEILHDEYREVLDRFDPDTVVLVSDGAEDAQIHPILYRPGIKVVSEQVYVKQARTLEGSFYYFKNLLSENNKRKRLIGPLALVVTVISLFYVLTNILLVFMRNYGVEVVITPTVFLIIGLFLMLYAYEYNIEAKMHELAKWRENVGAGNMGVISTIVAVLVTGAGLVYSYVSLDEVYTSRMVQLILHFIYSFIWFAVLSMLIQSTGRCIQQYRTTGKLKVGDVTFSIYFVAIGFLFSGVVDFLMNDLKLQTITSSGAFLEVIVGIVLLAIPSFISRYVFRKYLDGGRSVEVH